ncbi:cystatin-like isoform X2 [Salvelinus alpinus]|uniref:cystatin-like isoform X2 n=1 Tax=Salvelinus alpinus TaxID=8036 RepID=UPI0039FB974C
MLMNWKIVVPLLAVAFIVTSADGIPGGVVDADMNDPATRDALQFAVAEYNKGTNDPYVWQVAKVVKAQKQRRAAVRRGRIQQGNKRPVCLAGGQGCQSSETETRCSSPWPNTTREQTTRMFGRWPRLSKLRNRDALQFAVAEYNKGTNDPYVWQVAKVVKAQKQVVAGMKYIFTVQMARTLCMKGRVKDCTVHQYPAVTYQCIFEVWSRPRLGEIQLIKQACEE